MEDIMEDTIAVVFIVVVLVLIVAVQVVVQAVALVLVQVAEELDAQKKTFMVQKLIKIN